MKRVATLLACLLAAAPAAAATKLVIGTVPNVGDGATICAIERGYFREVDLEIDLTPFRTASDMTPLIVRGDLAMIGGGVSASYFNSVAQGMPLRYFINRAQSPVHHALVLRKEFESRVKTLRDVKGLRIGISATGAISEYELGKALEVVGLSLDDVDTKPLGAPQAVAALQNGAIDGAIFVPPFDAAAIKAGGYKLLEIDSTVKPRMEVGGLIYNTDWAAKNRDTLDRFALAHIRGGRCYLEALRGGPNRDEMIDYFVKYSPIKDRSIFADMVWTEINPDGRVMADSMMDQQEFFAKRGYVPKKSPIEALFDPGPVERALAKLGALQK